MDIGKIIKRYRESNNLSLRDFAIKCGTSHSYIAMLENGKNSKTGEPIIPTLTMLNKISLGLGITLNELLSICDDIPVSLSQEETPEEPKLTEGEKEFLYLFKLLPKEAQASYIERLREALKTLGLI
jgi:transcriptional regulator with XRE-family HTH domain